MTSRALSKFKFFNCEFNNFSAFKRYCTQLQYAKPKKEAHSPVMIDEVVKYMNLSPGETIVDMTFGSGGHSRKLLETIPNIKIYALDRDPLAYEFAENLALEYPGQVIPLLGRFSELPELLKGRNVPGNTIDGILFDFGCSSMQFDTGMRGFSISRNGPLDMRMDGERFPNQPTAADIIEKASEEDLARIIKVYGEEKEAKKIARVLVESRFTLKKLRTTRELAEIVKSAISDEEDDTEAIGRQKHCATKTFQAFRIFVNNELNEINYGLFIARAYLKIGGRLITLSFHSLEDLIVKRHISGNFMGSQINKLPLKFSSYGTSFSENELNDYENSNWHMLHPHVLVPEPDEIEINPRSRSARFRAMVKVS
ncbi:probable methyltransferase-like protein 15 homolog [Leptopilina heterotoma]|uniref:probable methyltransferase-like protein 15 homolog n=1 Tax=Leptopilina heterotoma TaxID=63436 RepID=UPI001CAA091F|nr:probable methyltransferase-like protein 15 homolog [Leptopilina heterotoma]